MNHASEEIILKKSESQNQSLENKNINVFHVRTQQKLGETIRKLKLHTTSIINSQSTNDKNKRIFLKWIELTDLNTKCNFCFPVEDYLPSSPGDALELTEVHQDSICEENNQQEVNKKYSDVEKEKNRTEEKITNIQSNDHLQSIRNTTNSSELYTNKENKADKTFNAQFIITEDKSKYAKLYDIRTKTAHQGFLGIKSLMKANVYVKLYDIHHQSSESIPLTISRLHERPFRSNQTDQFQVGTIIKLGPLKKVEIWHDGKKGTRLHCDTLEITDQSNGQIYCFQIKEYLDNDTKLILTDYDNRRCLDIHSEYQKLSTKDAITYQNKDDDLSILSNTVQIKSQLLPATQQKTSLTNLSSAITSVVSSNTHMIQTLFKVRTRVGHKTLLSLGLGGTDFQVYIRIHEGEKVTEDILLNNSLTHNNPFESGHIDVFEIGVPQYIISPDRIEIFHKGKKHDGLYLKWIEVMNMNTLERKCFPVNRWLELNEADKKTHIMLRDFIVNESCEENEYREHHSHDQYKTEYVIRTKTSLNQPINNSDTHANIYLKIYNDKKKYTEDMLLSHSKHHTNPFRAGKIDKFEIGSIHLMDDTIDRIELWHDNTSNFDWFCEWIEIKNKKTDNIKCFGVNRILSRKSSDGTTKIVLTIHSHYPCDKIERELHNLANTVGIQDRYSHIDKIQYIPQRYYHSPNKHDFTKKYIITIKTGNKTISGTDINVFIRLYDDQNRQSEDMLLEQTVTNKIPFQKHAVDEFHTGILNNLSNLQKVHLWYTGEKNEGWNVEWLQIEDIDMNHLYCFPVNKWFDSNSNDRTTHIVLTEFTVNEPCSRLSSQKGQKNNQLLQFKRSYHVETKTGTKGFLRLSPTGTNAKVYMRIHDKNGQVSEPIELHQSINHKNKFERGQTDEFDVGSTQSLDGVDKLELWHDDTGIGHGWFADYVAVIDNKTGEEACFFIGEYLNKQNGGIEEKHLILDKQTLDNRPCRDHKFDVNESTIQETVATGNPPTPFTQTYRIEIKTGHTGLFGLGGANTNVNVFIRIHDNNDNMSESLQLKHSLKHKNKFERNQTDQFDVGTRKSLDGVKKVELWHESDKNEGWQVDFIQVIDNKTGNSYCFFINAMLNKNSGLKKTHVLLQYPSINVSCLDELQAMKQMHNTTTINMINSQKNDKIERNFTIRTKTGNQIEAGSTTPIHIQLFDDQDQKSEDIRLKHKDHDKHNFEPGAIDEFQVTSFQPLSNKLIGIRVKHNADKYQGWYAEWIEITDEDNIQTYCYPIQRWLDKAENDKQTDIYFTDVSDVPCDSLLDTMPQSGHRSIPTIRETPVGTVSSLTYLSQTSAQTLVTSYKNTYHVKTKTGKKGFLGFSPTGTNAKVFLRIIDKNGDVSENLQLHGSTDHKNKFQRGRTDEFDIGTNKQLNGIDQIELWTDGKGLGSGWFLEYIQVTDNKTGDIACFPVNQYLNHKNGGIEDNPLRLKRVIDERSCQESIEDSNDIDNESEEQMLSSNVKFSALSSKYKNTFSVITKTGHVGLGSTRTHTPVFIRLHDIKGKISEAIQLQNSIRHTNKFEKNQTDQFDVGICELLEDISRVELWHENDKNNEWQLEYIQIIDNQTNTSYCFPVNKMLDKNYGSKQTHILLETPLINISCSDQSQVVQRNRMNTDMTSSKKKKDKYVRNFTIRTRTGNQIEAGSTTPIHIQLFDDQQQSSEDIRLKHHNHDKHNFEPDAIDEFQVISHQPLSNQLTGIRIKHNADKYLGWFCEWIEIIDDDNGKIYCYPIQRWLDKAENDKKTDVYFTNLSDVPCSSLPDTMMESGHHSVPVIQKSHISQLSSEISSIPFQNTYHVETKTGKKGFLGLSSTGTNANIYIQIIDRNGNKSEPIQLKASIDHKNKFERGHIDEFDIGVTKLLNGINQLEIWTDGKGLGHGWYADYVIVTDNRTGEEACFLIGEYLNKENGGIAINHLILDKLTGNMSCRERHRKQEDDLDTIRTRQIEAIKSIISSSDDSSSTIVYKRTYHIDTKTGRKGFLGLSPTGTNADVYLQIHDKSGHISEPISLRCSTKHSNPFEKGKTDSFDVGTKESLDSIAKLELYHDGTDLGHGWNVDYVNILDNTTGHNYCFPANKWLSNSEHLILDNYVSNVSCEEVIKEQMEAKIDTNNMKTKQKRSFTVQTKTGSQVEAGSTTPIYIRLFDNHSQKSEKIRLKQKDKDGHHFEPGSIDEFHITSDKPLNTLTAIEISHSADKYQGWYGEWISVTDNDENETYCFPLQRWLDKGELDGKTDIYLKHIRTMIPCEQLPDTMKRQSLLLNRSIQSSTIKNIVEGYKSLYHVQTKTAKKGLLGLSPTGTDANVFIRIHDKDGKISEPLELKNSIDHKNKFARGKIDDFDVGSIYELNNIDKLELWTDSKGIGNGWYPEYIQITDQRTNEVSCFVIEQNEKYGGLKNDHLILDKQKDNRLCQELKKDDTINLYDKNYDQAKQNFLSSVESQGRFQVEIKTGHTGFLGLGSAGTDASVFIRIYDSNDRKSEAFQLKHSTKHKNKFERNQTDHFIVHTDEPFDSIAKLDLWHEGNKNDGWQVDYVNIIDNKTNTSYCFPVNTMLDQNSGFKQTSIHLENPLINIFCKEETEAIKKSHSYTSISKKLKSDKLSRNYTVRTKTGNHASAGSTTPIHLQLIDIYDKKSKDIQLKKKDMEGHHFAPGNIDEFKFTLPESLSTLKAVKLSLDADKYQGWYGEWISITDDDNQETYCFPIQRWLDKGEHDHKTHVTLYQQSTIPCNQLSDSILIRSSSMNNEDNEPSSNSEGNIKASIISSLSLDHQYEYISPHDFQVHTKTADKSLQGKLGRDANVYLNIYDKNNKQISSSIRLQNSKNHKIPFQRHHTDKFHITIPNIKINNIDRIDLYHDGQNDGWLCDFVEIKNPQTNETKCFSVHQWLDKVSDDRIQFSMTNYQNISCDDKQHATNHHYYILRIKTNTTNLTSNDSVNIFIKLFGKSHQTEQIQLDQTIDNKQAFRRNNSIDIFEIRTSTKLNSLQKIEFFYEFSSNNRKFSIEWIEITNLLNGIISCFPVNRILTQLDINRGMQQILTLNESNNKPCSY
ncbi:unnamed protein product [Rotaria sordida]|uniref:PLAT domain-containing protein n=1 Tax=Rotaria sordida TaxID=392033 RepID=A0A819BWN8_9BILA|nr:unnamed protein product [Rotaria sordida]